MAVSWLEAHIAQANHNINLFNEIHSESGNNRFNDWKVTVLFYTALHLSHARVVIALEEKEYTDRMVLKRQNGVIPLEKRYLTEHHYFNQFISPTPKKKGNKEADNQNIPASDPNNRRSWFYIQFNTETYLAYEGLYNLSRVARYLKDFDADNNNFNLNFIDDSIWIDDVNLRNAHDWITKIIDFMRKNGVSLSTPLNPI